MAKKSKLLKFKGKRTQLQTTLLAMMFAMFTTFLFWMLPTQWFAAKVGYDRGLGEPLWIATTFAVYMPSDWLEWGWRYASLDTIKPLIQTMQLMGYVVSGLGLGTTLIYLLVFRERPEGMDDLHGSAHWADVEMIDSTGYLSSPTRIVDGAMIGSVMLDSKGEVIHPMHPDFGERLLPIKEWKRIAWRISRVQVRNKDGVPQFKPNKKFVKKIEYLRADDPTHILAFAPTRSGKGVGLVLPTLLSWRHSVVVNDIKGENWALSAGFRQKAGQIVMKFEPACQDGSTACWNPIDEIRAFTPNDVQDAQGMMMMVCDPKGEGLEDHWAKTSWEFLSGLALHLRYVGGTQGSIAGMASYLGDPNWSDERQMYTAMQNFEHDPEGKMGWTDTQGNPTKIHPMVANAATTMLNKEDKERTSVLSTAKSFLSLYLDPIIAKNTSRSDFLVRDLMNSDKPVSLYYVVQPNDLDRMVPLSRLFWAMVIRRNASEMSFADGTSVQGYKHRLLLLIDELPALKKLTVLQEGLGYIAGYGMKCFLICQDTIQLEEAYGDKQTIVAGCHVRIAYAPNTSETATKLSEMTGKTTILEQSYSDSQSTTGALTGNVSVSTNKTERALMTPDEFLSMSPEDMVIFVAGKKPIYGRKIKYYEDQTLLGRAKIVAPARSDQVRKAAQAVDRAAASAAETQKVSDEARQVLLAEANARRNEWAKQSRSLAQGNADYVDSKMKQDRLKNGSPQGEEEGDTGSAAGSSDNGSSARAGRPGGQARQSYYQQHVSMSDHERAQVKAAVQRLGLVEQVASFKVF